MTTRFSQRQVLFLISAALVMATLVAYEPIRHNGFINYDDTKYITQNPNVSGGITQQSVIWAFTKSHSYMWHPLTTISHILDCQLFGLNPLGHHLVSVLLHIANALLLFLLLSRITGSTISPQAGAIWPSAFVAAVFALHPLQVESVAWAAERKTVLSGLFWFLTIAVYIWYAKRPGIRRYILLLVVYALCIMTKPVVVTVPLTLLLLDYWPLGRLKFSRQIETQKSKTANLQRVSAGRLILEKIPLLALSAILSVITFVAQHSGGIVVSLERIPLNYRINNMFLSYITYIGKMIWPSHLAVFYPSPMANLSVATAVVCSLLFFLITAISIYIGLRRKYAAVGWLWFVGTLVPMIGLVQSGAQAMADRYMYIPMLGLLIIFAWAVKDLVANRPRLRIIAAVLALIVLSTLLIFTRIQVSHWQNSLTLFGHALKVAENNELAENNYGCSLLEVGRLSDAELHFHNAVRINQGEPDAYNNLGKAFLKQNKLNEAIACFNELLQRKQDSAEIHYNWALALSMQKKYDDAIKHLDRALDMDPHYPDARNRMGVTLLATGRINESIECFNELLQQHKDSAEVHYNWALALSMQKKYDDAIKHLAKALDLDPRYPDARNRMGVALLATGRINEAIVCFNELLRQKEDSAEVHFNWALALSMQKKYEDAMKQLAVVLKLDPDYPGAHEVMGISLLAAGRPKEALEHLNDVLRTSKEPAKVYENLGKAYAQLGQYRPAIQNWTKAVELKPDSIPVLNDLAWLLATTGDVNAENADRAVKFAQSACELTGYKKPEFLDTLAAAYAAAGRFEDAVNTAKQAVNAAKASNQEDLANEIQNHITLYQAGRRYQQR